MTRTIKLLSFLTILLTLLTILAFWTIPINVTRTCLFTSQNNSCTIALDHKMHSLIQNKQLNKCEISIDHANREVYLTYQSMDSDANMYIYWASIDETYIFSNETFYVPVNFGDISIPTYIYYLGV